MNRMAKQMVCRRSRLVAYMPSFGAAATRVRSFSTRDEQTGGPYIYVNPPQDISVTVWPDGRLGPFAPKDQRFPMPGLVGSVCQVDKKTAVPQVQRAPAAEADVLTAPLPEERHLDALSQFFSSADELEDEEEAFMLDGDVAAATPANALECAAYSCPTIIRLDFQELFPGVNVTRGAFTVITMSQKTDNDMTKWNPDVEVEREALLASFVESSQQICERLVEHGYWADFIDPSSGRPYLGKFTNATMFETDERYRHFGFDIDDLGCCKVVRHHAWGTRSFVGCLFTNAPVDSPIMQHFLQTRGKGGAAAE